MKVRGHSIICELLKNRLSDYLDLIRNLILTNTLNKTVLILKPAIVPVIPKITGRLEKKFLVFSPFSFIIEADTSIDESHDIEDIILSGTYEERLRCFEVAEDVWIEGKKLLTIGERSVECLGGGPIAELVRRLGLTCNDGSSVVIVDEYSTVNDYEEKLLNRKHIVNALGLSDTVVSEITGRLNYFWSTHPLLYGLPNNLEIKVKLVTLSQFRKVSLIGRPLLFIEKEPLIIELTHNNSVVFLGFNDYLMELVLRAILYVL